MRSYHFSLKNSLMSILVLGLLLCQFSLFASMPKLVVAENLPAKEANIVIAYLHAKSIEGAERLPAKSVAAEALFNVVVPSYDKAAAIRHLNLAQRAPRELIDELCPKELIPSDKALNEKWQQDLELFLSSVIRKQKGITDAEVKLSFPDENLPYNQKKVMANVWLEPSEDSKELNPFVLEKIKEVLTKTVFNLTSENIFIND